MQSTSTHSLRESAAQTPTPAQAYAAVDLLSTNLTSAAICQEYYKAQQRAKDGDVNNETDPQDGCPDENLGLVNESPTPTPTPTIKSSHDDAMERDDVRSVTSISTIDSCDGNSEYSKTEGQGESHHQGRSNKTRFLGKKILGRSGTIFRSKTGQEPSIVVQHAVDREDHVTTDGLSILSKLSKRAAPVRACLSAISNRGSRRLDQLRHLRTESSVSLSLPLRRSAESVFNIPMSRSPKSRLHGERSHSFSFGTDKISPQLSITQRRRKVYPALLSRVAATFKDSVTLSSRTKNNIKYMEVFDGREAVEKLMQIVKTNDRNLALLLGRALDAQKLFHDVNYEHRLRDSPQELYQLRALVGLRSRPDEGGFDEEDDMAVTPTLLDDEERSVAVLNSYRHDNGTAVSGVFTLLTECYSPTCTREQLCYSTFCPRRLEQRVHAYTLNQPQHQRTGSRSSLLLDEDDDLWIHNVAKEVADKLSKEQRKRQEHIFEFIVTERDFVNDLLYIKEHWILPLSEGSIVDVERRASFVKSLFWNITDIYEANRKFSKALQERQTESPVVDSIGDILLQHVQHFEPFVHYGAHQIISKHVLETERVANASFAWFVDKTERLPQSRKLELNGFLTKPTTRLGRYNLLLREILKQTPLQHPDRKAIPEAMKIITEFLVRVNQKAGEAESRFNLDLLHQRLLVKPLPRPQSVLSSHTSAPQSPIPLQATASIRFDLGLADPQRQLIMKGPLKKKGSSSSEQSMLVFLLDHSLLIVKPKYIHHEERYKLYREPVPLQLLFVSTPDSQNKRSLPPSRTSTSSFYQQETNVSAPVLTTLNKTSYPISFAHLGRHGGTITLYCTSQITRRQWIERIEGQQATVSETHDVFDLEPIHHLCFGPMNRVTCSASFDHGRSLLLGSDQGIYLLRDAKDKLTHVLPMAGVSQMDVLEGPRLVLILADKTLYSYSLDAFLTSTDPGRSSRRIGGHVSFYKVGRVLDSLGHQDAPVEKLMVCYVRCNAMTSTIRALEPCETPDMKKKHTHLGRLIRGSNDGLRVYKELYIPGEASSLQFFKNVICVGCAKGFQMVNLRTAQVQSVLDPTDENNSMILEREHLKPISMFRHEDSNILLCYNDMAFYIDKKGKRARSDWSITWEGHPTTFAWRFPYVLAFDPHFVEIRHVDTGNLVQVIAGTNIRCLRPDSTDTIHMAMEDKMGEEKVFHLVNTAAQQKPE